MRQNCKIILIVLAILLAVTVLVNINKNHGTDTGDIPKENLRVLNSGPASLTGIYVCLPHRGVLPGQPQNAECAGGLRTDDGTYYALDLSILSGTRPHNLFPGDRIIADGILSPVTEKDEDLYRYEADILLQVNGSVKLASYELDGILYSSVSAAEEIMVETPKADAAISFPFTLSGFVREEWLSKGQWGPSGTLRAMIESRDGRQLNDEITVTRTGPENAEGLVPFKGTFKYGLHTKSDAGFIVIYRSNFSEQRDYIKVPVLLK